jgi:hypothetical protein
MQLQWISTNLKNIFVKSENLLNWKGEDSEVSNFGIERENLIEALV